MKKTLFFAVTIAFLAAVFLTGFMACKEPGDTSKGPPGIAILTQPVNINMPYSWLESSIQLTVKAELQNVDKGTTLAYQWHSATAANGSGSTPINDETGAAYEIPSETEIGTYYFYVVVSCSDDEIEPETSRVATVIIAADPSVRDWTVTYTPKPWAYNFSRSSLMANNPQMWHNDVLKAIDEEDSNLSPVLQNGVLMVPFNGAKTVLGNLTWNVSGNTITASLGNTTAVLTTNIASITIGSNLINIDAAPVTIDDTLYIPIAPVANALNAASIGWHEGSSIMVVTTGANVSSTEINWSALRNQPPQWYGGERSITYATNLTYMQRNNGGWPRGTGQGAANVGTSGSDHYPSVLNFSQASINYHNISKWNTDSYFGRGITTHDTRYMLMMYEATKIPLYRTSFVSGLNAILTSQYTCGGWPYYVTDKSGYRGSIIFSDESIATIMRLLTDIINENFPSAFGPGRTLANFQGAYNRGLQSILNLQVWSVEQQMLTAWAQGYNANDLMTGWAQNYLIFPNSTKTNKQPTWIREFEPPAIGGDESIGIIRFLMDIPNPSEEVKNAIHAAVAFFAHVEIHGYRNTSGLAEFGTGGNRVLIEDPNGSVWARFIDINTFEPLFSDRRTPTLRNIMNTNLGMTEVQAHASRGGVLFANASGTGGSTQGNLRNIYVDNDTGERINASLTNNTAVVHPPNATLDLIASFANLSHERRNGYNYMGTWPGALPDLYSSWLTRNELPVPVSNIRGIPGIVLIGQTTLNGIVVPSSAAHQNIQWSLVDPGATGASITGNVLSATSEGTAVIKATITGGTISSDYTKEFTIQVSSYIPVTEVSGVPAFLPIGRYNLHRLAVAPAYATAQNLTLTIANAGGTGATLNGRTLTTTSSGTVTLRITVNNGLAPGQLFTQDFNIIIHPDPTVAVDTANIPSGALISNWRVLAYLHNVQSFGKWNVSYNKNFKLGDEVYGDRGAVFGATEIPSVLLGKDWLASAQDARNQSSLPVRSQMVFTARQNLNIYLAFEMRVNINNIHWIDDTWEFLGVDVILRSNENRPDFDLFADETNEGTAKYYIFRKSFSRNNVVRIGAIQQGTSLGNVVVFLEPR
ncbi:MAG: hypothetical protein LBC80_01785 [Treponema sp.]|jgi:PelA/Pel-15E family pectate lyase|nr:hypothetical protein [Treponema sp.]